MGKSCSRGLNCHKTLTEAIFRLLFNKLIEEHDLLNNLKLLAEGFCKTLIKIAERFLQGNQMWKIFWFNDFIQSS